MAAIRAAQLGQKVAVVEREALGGVCLNWGCIPTKALLRNAEVINLLGQGNDFGFKIENLTVDYAPAQKRSRQVSDRLVKGVGFLFRKNNITHVAGHRRAGGAEAGQGRRRPGRSSRPRTSSSPPARGRARCRAWSVDGKRIITSREALELTAVPKRLVVVGAGAIGMEFAYLFRSYGAEVTVIEMLPHVLPLEDDETAAEVAKAFKRQGIVTLVNTRTEAVESRAMAA